jgi:hypothetical protein
LEHMLTPSSTGEEISVGLFVDVKNTFSLGGLGFIAPFGEAFQIDGLSVQPATAK